MKWLAAVLALGLLFVVPPVRAGEIIEYKGAVLVREEERGVMVFKVKDGEIKAPPSLGTKGYDQNSKEYSTGIEAAEKKQTVYQLLKIGNVFDLKINKVNAKTFSSMNPPPWMVAQRRSSQSARWPPLALPAAASPVGVTEWVASQSRWD